MSILSHTILFIELKMVTIKNMENINDRFMRFIVENDLIRRKDKILIALSGGADSVVMTHLLLSIKNEMELTLEAFHLNHQLRDEADEEERFVVDLCSSWKIPCHTHKTDIALLAAQRSISVEEAGREERYRILFDLLTVNSLTKIATAHHMDDNAETMIMRLIRGTGLKGLEGIPPKRNEIIRPMLFLTKEDIFEYSRINRLIYVTDHSNFEPDYLRNRIRFGLIADMKKENPRISQALMHLSQTARINNDFIDRCCETIEIAASDNKAWVDYHQTVGLHDAIKSQLIKNMAKKIQAEKDITFDQIKNILMLLSDGTHTTWDAHLTGSVFKRRYDKLLIERKKEIAAQDFSYPISQKGTFIFAKERFIIKTKVIKKIEKNTYNPYIKAVDYDKINNNLHVRNKHEGDFFYPLGLNGKKTLKKLFIDEKINKEDRLKVPLLCNASEIICVFGIQIDERYKITQQTDNYLITEYAAMEDSIE